MVPEKIVVVGSGMAGRSELSASALQAIQSADELWGAERFLSEFDDIPAKKVRFRSPLRPQLESLRSRGSRRIVVLASGDPGFYGIAATISEILAPEEITIVPNVSALQSAFAKAGVPWQDAALTSLHARPFPEALGLIRRHAKIGLLTEPGFPPNWIAEKILSAGVPDCRAVVCENLGTKDERILAGSLSEIRGMRFAPLNVLLLLQREPFVPSSIGVPRPDDAYAHPRGMITKRDVRLVTMDRLKIAEDDLVWDVGAGSGALSIEIGERAWRGRVFAIEKNAEALVFLRRNVDRFGALNVSAVEGAAPEALADLPAPTAVFIGGSGGKLEAILRFVLNRAAPNARLAANFTILENLTLALETLRGAGYDPCVAGISLAYGRGIGGGTRLDPINPVYVLSCDLGKTIQR